MSEAPIFKRASLVIYNNIHKDKGLHLLQGCRVLPATVQTIAQLLYECTNVFKTRKAVLGYVSNDWIQYLNPSEFLQPEDVETWMLGTCILLETLKDGVMEQSWITVLLNLMAISAKLLFDEAIFFYVSRILCTINNIECGTFASNERVILKDLNYCVFLNCKKKASDLKHTTERVTELHIDCAIAMNRKRYLVGQVGQEHLKYQKATH